MDKYTVRRDHDALLGWHFAVYDCALISPVARCNTLADARSYIEAQLFAA